jgi:hypothetical protein
MGIKRQSENKAIPIQPEIRSDKIKKFCKGFVEQSLCEIRVRVI